MAEQQAANGGEKAPKKERVAQMVKLSDGRTVEFVGNRRMNKSTVIDESKLQFDGDLLVVQPGAVQLQVDFVNGETRLYTLPLSLFARFAGHGGEQKYGDETAGVKDIDDMVIAMDDLDEHIQKGEWSVRREGAGDSFAGASVVIMALVEAAGGKKTVADIKAFLQAKLDAAKAADQKLSRKELYDSFRAPGSRTAAIIERIEKERLAKNAKVNADEELDKLLAA